MNSGARISTSLHVYQLGDYFCNSVGVLQQDTGPEQAQQTGTTPSSRRVKAKAVLYLCHVHARTHSIYDVAIGPARSL